MVLVYCPCPDLDEAKRLGHALVDARAAGCINILPGMVSLYDWDATREVAQEAVLLAKTRRERVPDVRAILEREHRYAVPAILVLPVTEVNAAYLAWIDKQIESPA